MPPDNGDRAPGRSRTRQPPESGRALPAAGRAAGARALLAPGEAGDRAGVTQDQVRRHNLAVLLEHLHRNGEASRAELTALLGLNRSTTAALVTDLVARGLVEQARATLRGRSGRPSLLVRLRPDRVVVLAVEVDVTGIRAALVGIGGSVLTARSLAYAGAFPAAGEVVETAVALARPVLASIAPVATLVAVGVGVAGVVRRNDGLVHIAPNLGWRNEPLGELMARALDLGVPVHVGNDADLGAVAEHIRGAARGISDVVYVSSDVGVGVGMLVGGRPLAGADGYFGEFGHLPLFPRGHRCRCGARGCWETEVGLHSLLRRAGLPLERGRAGVPEILTAAAGGDHTARAAVDHVADRLGVGLAAIVNTLNPRLIVLGGLFAELWPLGAARARRALVRHALQASAEQVTIVPTELGDDATLLGAAEVALAATIRDPTLLPIGVGGDPGA